MEAFLLLSSSYYHQWNKIATSNDQKGNKIVTQIRARRNKIVNLQLFVGSDILKAFDLCHFNIELFCKADELGHYALVIIGLIDDKAEFAVKICSGNVAVVKIGPGEGFIRSDMIIDSLFYMAADE